MRKGCFRGVLPPVKIHFCQRSSAIFSAQSYILSYPKKAVDAQQRPWSDCIDAQTQMGFRSPQANFHIGSYIFFISIIEKYSDLNMNGVTTCVRRKNIFTGVRSSEIRSDILFNLYHSLGIFSRRHIDDIFLIFPRKQDLTFHANCLLRRQFAWNVKSCSLGKIRKIFQNVVCWKFYPES